MAEIRRAPIARQSTEFRIAVMRLSRQIRLQRADAELSTSQFATLRWVVVDGPLTPGRLAELEQVTPPSMNRTVNCLADAGLVTREADPADGRRVLVRATREGTAIVDETLRRREAWLSQRYAALTPAERDVLVHATEIMGRLADR